MKILCFALILSQAALEEAAPPPHIQELLKKRVLYQIKQIAPERDFFFDDSTCSVVGLYEYNDDALRIFTHDKAIDLHLPYSDVLSGKKLELSAINASIDTRANIIAAVTSEHDPITEKSVERVETNGNRKWLPWIIVGAAGLALGGYAVYKSGERKGGETPPPARRPR
jgi:hypothetical protein